MRNNGAHPHALHDSFELSQAGYWIELMSRKPGLLLAPSFPGCEPADLGFTPLAGRRSPNQYTEMGRMFPCPETMRVMNPTLS
jgi:hypothetical protein